MNFNDFFHFNQNAQQAIQMQLQSLPLMIVCYPTRSIVLQPLGAFKPILEYIEDKLVVIHEEGVAINIGEGNSKCYDYGVQYFLSEEPELVKWLQSLNMSSPV